MMEPTFEKFLVHLLRDEVRFIVVGGLAVTLNGYVRLTEDIDILIDLSPSNIPCFIDSLRRFGEGYGGEMELGDFTPEPGAIRLVEESEQCQVDIFSCLAGLFYEDLIEGAEQSMVGGFPFNYASKEQLIEFKSSSVREKDQLDVLALKQLIENPAAFE